MTQGDAAALFGVTQPRVSDLMRGTINLFSLDTLIGMAATAGMSPTVKVSKLKAAKHARLKRVVLLILGFLHRYAIEKKIENLRVNAKIR